MGPTPGSFALVVTAHRGGPMLKACLASVAALDPPPGEAVVAVDGDDPAVCQTVREHGLRLLCCPAAPGVAATRNAGARATTAEFLLFVDSDVLLPQDFVARAAEAFSAQPQASAIIGSYDDAPAAPGTVSRYRNLLHHYTHQLGRAEARTFWAGCGAVRREHFVACGGFSETYTRPSVEDIELGYRLRAAGGCIRLVASWQVKHLKRWYFSDLVITDFTRRAVPWTRLLQSRQQFVDDLNIDFRSRASVALAWTALGLCLLSPWRPRAGLAGAGLLGLLTLLHRRFYCFLAGRGGPGLALGAIPCHWLYFLVSGAGFVAGSLTPEREPGAARRRNSKAGLAGPRAED